MWIRFAKLLGVFLGLWALAAPARVSATIVQTTVSGSTTGGSSTYVYAFAKAGDVRDKKTDSSLQGNDLNQTAQATEGARQASTNSSVTTAAGLRTLRVETNEVGTRTRTEGYAQVGTTYVAASPVFVDLVFPGRDNGAFPNPNAFRIDVSFDKDTFVGYRLNDLVSDGEDSAPDQIDGILLPPGAPPLPSGFVSNTHPTNFFFLDVFAPPGLSSNLFVQNRLGPDTTLRDGSDPLLTNGDFELGSDQRGPFWILKNTHTFLLAIDRGNNSSFINAIDAAQNGSLPLTSVLHVSSPNVIPEPSTVMLLGVGLLSLVGMAWKRKRG